METKITKHYFEFGTQKYFRGNAHLVELGTYGEKKDPIGVKASLDPESKVKTEHLEGRVKVGDPFKIDWNDVLKADLEAEADLKYLSFGKSGALDFDYEKAKTAKLELVNMFINPGPLKTVLNQDAGGARNFLAREGNDSRIVSEIWVVVDAELAEQITANGLASAAVQAFGSSLGVALSGSKNTQETVIFPPGVTFAYKLHKVKDWNKDKTVIEELEADYKGMG